MFMPDRYNANLGDVFNSMLGLFDRDMFSPVAQRISAYKGNMKTDIKEVDGNYEFSIELPGYDKKDIKVELEDGYLTVSATTSSEKEEKSKAGKVVHSERTYGSVSRTYFVGEEVTQEDIKAKFDSGELLLTVKKKEKEVPKKDNSIYIE